MLQKEIEQLTGKQVTADEYKEIERCYMAAYGMDKLEFCQSWNGDRLFIMSEMVKHVEALEKKVKALAAEKQTLEQTLESKKLAFDQELIDRHYRDMEVAGDICRKANEYDDTDLKHAAVSLVGLKAVVEIDLRNGWELNDKEREYLMAAINATR